MLPSGMSGLVGMFRNWTFTLMFCMVSSHQATHEATLYLPLPESWTLGFFLSNATNCILQPNGHALHTCTFTILV